MKNQKIILCTSSFEKAIPKYFFELGSQLQNAGFQVIFLFDEGGQGKKSSNGFQEFYWPSKRPTGIKDFLFFLKLCIKEKPDYVLGQFGSVNIVLLVSAFLGIPNRWVYWHTMFLQISTDSRHSLLFQKILNFRKKTILKLFSTHIFTNSHATQNDLMKHYQLPLNNLSVMHYLIPDQFGREKFLLRGTREYACCFVGRLDKSKGQEKIIRIWPQIQRAFPSLKLFLIGSGSEEIFLKNLVSQFQLQEVIYFTGSLPLDQVYQKMSHCLVHISASVEEAFGLVNAEALAAGTPLLATKVGGIVDILEEGRNGFFMQPESAEDVVSKLKELLSSNWENYSQWARDTFENKFKSNSENLKKQVKLILEIAQD